MQSTISLNKLFLIAVVIATMISANAQQTNEKSGPTPAALERVGVESADALPLSLNEAIKLALSLRSARVTKLRKFSFSLTA